MFSWSADGRNFVNTHHWVVEGYQPIPPIIAADALPYSFRRVLDGHPFSFSSLDDLPAEAVDDRAFFEKHGPRSNLSFPLVAGGSVVGGLAFGTLRHEREWHDVVKERLAIVADIFANALAAKNPISICSVPTRRSRSSKNASSSTTSTCARN